MSDPSQVIVEMYLTELVERASGNYDPYDYIEEHDDTVPLEDEDLIEWYGE